MSPSASAARNASLACKEANDLPEERPWRWVRRITDLSSARWTTILDVREPTRGGVSCDASAVHCLEPACVEACIVGALKKTPEGPVIYDPDICIGCRYCMVACPWEIPKYSWEDTVPYVQKCDLCYERVKGQGQAAGLRRGLPHRAPPSSASARRCSRRHAGGSRPSPTSTSRRSGASTRSAAPRCSTSPTWTSSSDELKVHSDDKTPMPQRTFKVLHHMPDGLRRHGGGHGGDLLGHRAAAEDSRGGGRQCPV